MCYPRSLLVGSLGLVGCLVLFVTPVRLLFDVAVVLQEAVGDICCEPLSRTLPVHAVSFLNSSVAVTMVATLASYEKLFVLQTHLNHWALACQVAETSREASALNARLKEDFARRMGQAVREATASPLREEELDIVLVNIVLKVSALNTAW